MKEITNSILDSSFNKDNVNPDLRADCKNHEKMSEKPFFNVDSKAEVLKNQKETYNPDDNFLGNVERGKEMTFTEADSGSVNPNLEESEGFQCNCQTCVVVFEARLRGWDIEAKPFSEGSNLEKLSEQTNLAWVNSDGKHPEYIYNLDANSTDAMYDFIADTVKPGERYTLQGIWKGPWGCGHIISVFREETGNLVFYDPQVNITYNERGIKENVLSMMQKGSSEDETIKLLRVDNLSFDKQMVDPIVRRSEAYV